jgi:hypothetical protein
MTLGFANVGRAEAAAFDAIAGGGVRVLGEWETHGIGAQSFAFVGRVVLRGQRALLRAKAFGRSAVAEHCVFGGHAGEARRVRVRAVGLGDAGAAEPRGADGSAAAAVAAHGARPGSASSRPTGTTGENGARAATAAGDFVFAAAHRRHPSQEQQTRKRPRLSCFHRTEASKKGPASEPPSLDVSFSVNASERKHQTALFVRHSLNAKSARTSEHAEEISCEVGASARSAPNVSGCSVRILLSF